MVKYIKNSWLNKPSNIIAIKHKGKWVYYRKEADIEQKCSICGKIPYDFKLTNIKCPNGVEWRCPEHEYYRKIFGNPINKKLESKLKM